MPDADEGVFLCVESVVVLGEYVARFDSGWVKSYRLRYDHWLEEDLLARSVLDVLVRWANYEDSPSNAKIILKRGQCATSAYELSKRFKLGRMRIRRVLELLQERSVINLHSNPHGTIVTICNYDRYQSNEKHPTNQATYDQPTGNLPPTYDQPINKELKQLRSEEVKNLISPETVPVRASKKSSPEQLAIARKVWESYEVGYSAVYGTSPVRNAMVNGQIAKLVQRLGEEAPQVTKFYLGHRGKFYVEKLHPIGLLLADAEKLRTEWKTNFKMTTVIAQQIDHASAIDQIFDQFK